MSIPDKFDPMGTAELFPLPPLPVLPPGYTKKTWLQSNAKAYIDTKRLVTAVTTWVMTWEALSKNSYIANGVYTGNDDEIFTISYTSPAGGGYLTQWWKGGFFRSNKAPEGPITAVLSNYRKLTSVERLTIKMTGTFDLPTKTLLIFARNEARYIANLNPIRRVYRSTIFEANECVQDLVPCLDSAGKPCLFDGVTRRAFYGSAATDFTTD